MSCYPSALFIRELSTAICWPASSFCSPSLREISGVGLHCRYVCVCVLEISVTSQLKKISLRVTQACVRVVLYTDWTLRLFKNRLFVFKLEEIIEFPPSFCRCCRHKERLSYNTNSPQRAVPFNTGWTKTILILSLFTPGCTGGRTLLVEFLPIVNHQICMS